MTQDSLPCVLVLLSLFWAVLVGTGRCDLRFAMARGCRARLVASSGLAGCVCLLLLELSVLGLCILRWLRWPVLFGTGLGLVALWGLGCSRQGGEGLGLGWGCFFGWRFAVVSFGCSLGCYFSA